MNIKLLRLIIMTSKLTLYGFTIQCFLLTTLLASTGKAQKIESVKNVLIELELQNADITEAFRLIELQTDFKFAFDNQDIKKNKKISIINKEISVADVLLKISEEADLKFRQVNNYINVNKREKRETTKIEVIIQGVTISGKVTSAEDSDGLPGVNVIVKGTSLGTVTDVEGNYKLDVPDENSILVFSSVGFLKEEITVGNQTVIDFVLATDLTALEEIVVIGYGSVKKADLTGSVSQVSEEKISEFPVYEISEALKGRAAGVHVTQNSGSPGGRIQIRIRGSNSMIGSNEPLYVVDGYPITGDISYLNPSDIASMDILKDASATAIYGSRGANGVVIITTKKGDPNQDGKIVIESYFGVQEDANRYELLNAEQYAIVVNELFKNNGEQPFFNPLPSPESGTDWQDVIFRTGKLQNHSISFSKGSEGMQYSLSGNYFKNEGVLIGTGVDRAVVRFNLDSEIKKWIKIGTNISLSRQETDYRDVDNANFGNNYYSGALSAPPTLPVYDDNGLPTQVSQIYTFIDPTTTNPLQFADDKDKRTLNTFVGNAYVDFTIADGLTFKTIFGAEYNQSENEFFNPILYPGDRGFASESRFSTNSWLNENLLSYNKKLGDIHHLNVVAGFTVQQFSSKNLGISVSGFSNNTTENYDLGAAETINPPTSGINEWSLASVLARINYTLNGRYLFTASLRSDGSSKFAAENKWSNFPSAAFAWRISDEDFLTNSELINDLKLRVSYGLTGNQGINSYQTLNRLSSEKAIYGGGKEIIGFAPSAIANPNLKWETTKQFDIGFDIGLFNHRLRLVFDYYKKDTDNLLASVPLPPSIGFGSTLRNIGQTKNTGIEFSIEADIFVGDFSWNAYGQFSANRNEVVKLAGGADVFGGGLGQPFSSTLNLAREGESLGIFFGLVEDGIDENGFIKYVDQNEDGDINTLDRIIIGNPQPDFLFGFGSNFSYKNFELNMFFEGSYGNDVFFATAGTQLSSFNRGQNQFADLFGNYWTEENPDSNAKYPKISQASQFNVSDRFIEDASYLRLRSLKLGYNIPTEPLGISSWLKNAQIYFSVINLFTITDYPGSDPEVNTHGTDSQDVGDRLIIGIDESAYPISKTFALGLKLGF